MTYCHRRRSGVPVQFPRRRRVEFEDRAGDRLGDRKIVGIDQPQPASPVVDQRRLGKELPIVGLRRQLLPPQRGRRLPRRQDAAGEVHLLRREPVVGRFCELRSPSPTAASGVADPVADALWFFGLLKVLDRLLGKLIADVTEYGIHPDTEGVSQILVYCVCLYIVGTPQPLSARNMNAHCRARRHVANPRLCPPIDDLRRRSKRTQDKPISGQQPDSAHPAQPPSSGRASNLAR